MKDTQTELLFDSIDGKKVVADFTGGDVSSDAGLLLVRAVGRGMRLFERIASAIPDARREGSVEHDVVELLRQRTYQICAGYFHGIDCNRLRNDPVFKVVCERTAVDSDPLAGQSTHPLARLHRYQRRCDDIIYHSQGSRFEGSRLAGGFSRLTNLPPSLMRMRDTAVVRPNERRGLPVRLLLLYLALPARHILSILVPAHAR